MTLCLHLGLNRLTNLEAACFISCLNLRVLQVISFSVIGMFVLLMTLIGLLVEKPFDIDIIFVVSKDVRWLCKVPIVFLLTSIVLWVAAVRVSYTRCGECCSFEGRKIAFAGPLSSVLDIPLIWARIIGTFVLSVTNVDRIPASTLLCLTFELCLFKVTLVMLVVDSMALTRWVLARCGGWLHSLLTLASRIRLLVRIMRVISVVSWLPLLNPTLLAVIALPLPMTGSILRLSRCFSACRVPWQRAWWTRLLVASNIRLM